MADAIRVGQAGQIDQQHINGWPTIDQCVAANLPTVCQYPDKAHVTIVSLDFPA